jgi:hypothetical protein
MDETITLTKASLVELIEGLLYPNPDDPGDPSNPWGPYGPIGPVVRQVLREVLRVLLNPQPLPPHPDPWRDWASILLNPQPLPPHPDPWRDWASVLLNPQPLPPHPDPWRAALLARAVIDQAVALYRSAEMLSSGEQSERAFEAARSYIREFVDETCGTVPRRWPLPWPWPLKSDIAQHNPLDLLVAGAQFQKAADAITDSPLHADLTAAADQLFEAGLRRLESR